MSLTVASAASESKTTFSGFRSRCRIPRECRWYTANAICRMILDASCSALEEPTAAGQLHHERGLAVLVRPVRRHPHHRQQLDDVRVRAAPSHGLHLLLHHTTGEPVQRKELDGDAAAGTGVASQPDVAEPALSDPLLHLVPRLQLRPQSPRSPSPPLGGGCGSPPGHSTHHAPSTAADATTAAATASGDTDDDAVSRDPARAARDVDDDDEDEHARRPAAAGGAPNRATGKRRARRTGAGAASACRTRAPSRATANGRSPAPLGRSMGCASCTVLFSNIAFVPRIALCAPIRRLASASWTLDAGRGEQINGENGAERAARR
eukprot:scaffold12090_cov89-Isochrysis_galbana.AAC.1